MRRLPRDVGAEHGDAVVKLLEAFVRTLNGKQLRSLGWPAKDDPYWQLEANRAAVKMRYGVDLYSRL